MSAAERGGGGVTFTAELDVSGRRVTVVGGSADALGKISSLIQAGALVTVVSPQVATSIRDLAERGLVTWLSRNAESADFVGSEPADHLPA
jgi:siroheme synthase (precorrin-2 oxidase/ferrochelatase)